MAGFTSRQKFFPAFYLPFTVILQKKAKKNGMKFVKMHKNHFQNEKQVV